MPTWKDSNEAHHFMDYVFFAAARIVSDGSHESVMLPTGPRNFRREWRVAYPGRPWFAQQRSRHTLHPAVYDMMTHHMYRAQDWQQLLLEWPHRALTDPNRLAYTRDERSALHNGDSDAKAVVTTIGKYLTRHFPDAPSNLIRDISAKYTYGGSTTITKEMTEMLSAVINGPRSCMSSRFDLLCDDKVKRHPYAVYDPSLGWRMAVRTDTDGMVLGRCLVHESDEGKGFVRSYKRERNNSSHSGADEAIEAYLTGLGYAKWRGWPDHIHIMRYPLRNDGFLMPYIDGDSRHVGHDANHDNFRISDYNGFEACSTSGIINTYTCHCDDCGEGIDEGDSYSIGYHGDSYVGDCCIDNYTRVTGRRRHEYYVPDGEAICTQEGEYYDSDYLEDNDIVELHDGEYTHRDNAVFIESSDEYYHTDDDDVCYAEDTNQFELKEDCWQCTESRNYYTDDEDSVEVDGVLYHPDNAPEIEEETNETDGETK